MKQETIAKPLTSLKQLVYTCEEITTGKASRSYSGTRLYTIKGACQNQVNKMNGYTAWCDNGAKYELVNYELKRVNSDTI